MRLTRRQTLWLGCVGAPAATVAAVALRHGMSLEASLAAWVSPAERAALQALTPGEYATLKAVLRRIARAHGTDFPSPDTVGAAPWAERYIAGLHPVDRADMKRLLAVVEHLLPLGTPSTLPFVSLPGDDQDAVLASMADSPSGLLRGAFAGLKQLAALSYFRDPRTFAPIGYDGPLVPPAGSPLPRPVTAAGIASATGTTFTVDAVVVGAGAGGSMAAREIARAGLSVLLLEEGPDHPPQAFTQREDEMLAALYQDRGGRVTRDRGVLVLQGRGLGGSTIHNQNLCKRTPDVLLRSWVRDHGLTGWDPDSMAGLYSTVETDLGVAPIPDASVTANNQVLADGARLLGWRTARLSHNRTGCVGSGFCELGCVWNGKNNARKVVIPQAVAAGAVVRASTRVLRVTTERQPGVNGAPGVAHATGVTARDTVTGAVVTVRARAVVMAASAVGSAALAVASGLPDPARQHGRGLHLHPGAAVAGIFPREIAGWRGVPQSVECTQHLDVTPGSGKRIWIVPGFAHPVGTAAMLPGFGPGWLDTLRGYPQTAALVAMLHDESEGTVGWRDHRPTLDYALTRQDREQLARGLVACGEILLAAGAERVIVPLVNPVTARTAAGLRTVTPEAIKPNALPLTAVHPMGAMRAGADPARSVCDPSGSHHHVRGLFVADGGLFPTSIGGPPQVTIYATGIRVGRAVVSWLRG